MKNTVLRYRHWSVGGKLASITLGLVGALFIATLLVISFLTSALLERHSTAQIKDQTHGVINMLEMFDNAMNNQVDRFSKMFVQGFSENFVLDTSRTIQIGDQATPVLSNGGNDLNMDFSIADRFTKQTGVVATIFAKKGDDFVRISTSVKKENGERAIGTLLDRAHPGYAALLGNKSYSGIAKLFGKQYITKYTSINDPSGKLIGALFVGVDISGDMSALQDKIKKLKIGETGYFYVLNSKEGKDLGTVLIGSKNEGKNLLAQKDTEGKEFIQEILKQKQGVLRYKLDNPDTLSTESEEKIVAFDPFKNWNWIVVGETYTDEITNEITAMRNHFLMYGAAFLTLVGIILIFAIKRIVTLPLARTRELADKVANGDLSVKLNVEQKDEIGLLMLAVNGISEGLSSVVKEVRQGTEQITTASSEIASGNMDLSTRTEQQANALQETASAMDELTSTVKQNADNAYQANQLALSASEVALQGGSVVGDVISTMGAINASSHKIVDIISVIDGIAFQTNILALNAAVEAARAGEQGRGFAVVASEVRTLAQRSAAAAKEIKTLINDSVEQVATGSKLVEQAGVTMRDVVSSVSRVTDIVSEISHASQEQRAGIEQVNNAIVHMDKTTQENAALVEQAAAAAQSMKEQAHKLDAAVSTFKIDDNGTSTFTHEGRKSALIVAR